MPEIIRWLGIDPGLQHTGWGIIDVTGNRLQFVAAGVIDTNPKMETTQRLAQIAGGLRDVIATHQPSAAAVEETFVNKNAASSLALGQARGIALLMPAECGLPVHEFATNLIKKTVTGVGHAEKQQIQAMIKILLPTAPPLKTDAADAIAVAICAAQHIRQI
jgi:crossover junction endodeoxyribonuclease RuvC